MAHNIIILLENYCKLHLKNEKKNYVQLCMFFAFVYLYTFMVENSNYQKWQVSKQ